MASQTTCARGLVAETLSAWRDRALGQAEMRDIADHVRTCPRCQRQLTQFDIIGQALQRQHAPDLHARVWDSVQAGMTTRPRAAHGQRAATLGGASAMVALLVVAIIVFTALHANHGTRPPIVATTTTTATVIPVSSFTPAAQAWGDFPKDTLSNATIKAYPTDILADGSGYLGQQYNGQNAPATVVQVSLPAGNAHALYTPSQSENSTILSDGRYVIWYGNYVFTGGPGSLPYQSVGYIDTQTSKVTTLIAEQQGHVDDSAIYAADHGYFVWAPITATGEDLNLTDMASGVTTRIAALSFDKTLSGQDGGLGAKLNMHLSWPYIFYTNTEQQQHLYDITSGKDISLNQINQSSFDFNAFTLAGTALFWMHPTLANSNTIELDMLDLSQPAGAQPKAVVAFPRPYKSRTFANLAMISGLSASSHLVVWSTINGSYAWDRAQGRLVQIYAAAVQHTPTSDPSIVEDTRVLLHGNGLMYTSGSVDYNVTPVHDTTTYTFIDTSKLPTARP